MYSCKQCDRSFKSLRNLRNHQNRVYPCRKPTHQCNHCSRPFSSNESTEKHKRSCQSLSNHVPVRPPVRDRPPIGSAKHPYRMGEDVVGKSNLIVNEKTHVIPNKAMDAVINELGKKPTDRKRRWNDAQDEGDVEIPSKRGKSSESSDDDDEEEDDEEDDNASSWSTGTSPTIDNEISNADELVSFQPLVLVDTIQQGEKPYVVFLPSTAEKLSEKLKELAAHIVNGNRHARIRRYFIVVLDELLRRDFITKEVYASIRSKFYKHCNYTGSDDEADVENAKFEKNHQIEGGEIDDLPNEEANSEENGDDVKDEEQSKKKQHDEDVNLLIDYTSAPILPNKYGEHEKIHAFTVDLFPSFKEAYREKDGTLNKLKNPELQRLLNDFFLHERSEKKRQEINEMMKLSREEADTDEKILLLGLKILLDNLEEIDVLSEHLGDMLEVGNIARIPIELLKRNLIDNAKFSELQKRFKEL